MSTVKKVPMRQCVGCGEMKSPMEMMRIPLTTYNEIILDNTGKKNGRGAYICSSPECLKKAVKYKGLERALKTAVSAEVYEGLEREIGKFAEE